MKEIKTKTKKVQIKTWLELETEYEYTKDCGINVNNVYFTKGMEELLPKDRIIGIYYDPLCKRWFWKIYFADFIIVYEVEEDMIKR